MDRKKPYIYDQAFQQPSTLPYSPPPYIPPVKSQVIERIKNYTSGVDQIYSNNNAEYQEHIDSYGRRVYRVYQRSVSPNMGYSGAGGYGGYYKRVGASNLRNVNMMGNRRNVGRFNEHSNLDSAHRMPLRPGNHGSRNITSGTGNGSVVRENSNLRNANMKLNHNSGGTNPGLGFPSYQGSSSQFDSSNFHLSNNSNFYRNSEYGKVQMKGSSRFGTQEGQLSISRKGGVPSNEEYFDARRGLSFRSKSSNPNAFSRKIEGWVFLFCLLSLKKGKIFFF